MSTWPAIPTSLPLPTPFGSPEAAGIDMNAECSFEDPRVSVRPALQQRRETRDDIKTRGHSAGKYRFGFNGKEEDGETVADAYDFGARIYDARLGRWLAVDKVIKTDFSVYGAFCNNPLFWVDPSGNDDFFGIDGRYIGSNNNSTSVVYVVKHSDVTLKNEIVVASSNTQLFSHYMNSLDATKRKTLRILMRVAYHYYEGNSKLIGGARAEDAIAYYAPNSDAVRLCYYLNEEGKYVISDLFNDANNIRTALDHEEAHRRLQKEQVKFKDDWVNSDNFRSYKKGELEPFYHTLAYLGEMESRHFKNSTRAMQTFTVDGFIDHLNQALENIKSGNYPFPITTEMMDERVRKANDILSKNTKKGSSHYYIYFDSTNEKYMKSEKIVMKKIGKKDKR